jgi:hypothetical protein
MGSLLGRYVFALVSLVILNHDLTDLCISALCSVNGFKPPKVGSGVLIGGDVTQPEMKSVAVELQNLGYKLYCSNSGVESFLNSIPYVVRLMLLLLT